MKEQKNLIVWQDKVKLEIEILILVANRQSQQSVKSGDFALELPRKDSCRVRSYRPEQDSLGCGNIKGDALLQKTYTVDFLSKKRAYNNGQVPQYYVEDSHPAIIAKRCGKRYRLRWSADGILCCGMAFRSGVRDNR